MKRLIFSITLSIFLTACAQSGYIKESDPDISKIQKPTMAEDLSRLWIMERLKDPYSAQIQKVAGPKLYGYQYGFKIRKGYVLCYSVNAKNSDGGYTGNKLYLFQYDGNDRQLVDIQERDDPIGASRIINACNDIK